MEGRERVVLKGHNDVAHLIDKPAFLADLGMRSQQSMLARAIKAVPRQQTSERVFQVPSNYPAVFSRSKQDEWLWLLCDTPLITVSLVRVKVAEHDAVKMGEQMTPAASKSGQGTGNLGRILPFNQVVVKCLPCPAYMLLV